MPAGPAPWRRTVALKPVRHACHTCGNCCTGWRVAVADDERERIMRCAEALGVSEPIGDDGMLRQLDASCVFLSAERLCRIHERFGEDAKPHTCRSYPRIYLRTEDALRVGADPGCSSTWRTFRDGPLIGFERLDPATECLLPAEQAESEEQIIRLASQPGMHIAHFIGAVCQDTSHLPAVSPALVGRVLTLLKPLEEDLRSRGSGPFISADLAGLAALLRDVDPAAPPPLEVSDEVSELALETIQRHVFLRLGDKPLPPMGQVVMLIVGVIACALADPRLQRFGPALAAWSRMARWFRFASSVIPDAATALWLLTGTRRGGAQVG